MLCTVGTGETSQAPGAGGLFHGCGMYRTLNDIKEAWREGRITYRNLVLAEVKAFFEGRPGVDPACDASVIEDLKADVLEDVFRLSDQLNQSDKLYISSVNGDLAAALDRAAAGPEQPQQEAAVPVDTTFDRIAKALDEGRIDLKESVLLRAKLLYVPRLIPPESEFAPLPGEPVAEKYGAAFIKDVHRVKDLLNKDEKAFLRSLSPDLEAIVESWEGVRNALPSYPQLDKTYTGAHCVVHYTLKGPDRVAGVNYVISAASYIEEAISDEGHDFHPAYPQGGGKLQVYILGSTTIPGLNGEWVDGSDVPFVKNAKSGWMLINASLDMGTLKATAYHEYFHGVQDAYNWQSDLWFLEGSANWAEGYYGSCWKEMAIYFSQPDSIFREPNANLWITTGLRRYSTSALVFFFTDNFHIQFMQNYFNNSRTENDAVANLGAALARACCGAGDFGDEYKKFLIRMYYKKIPSIKAYMPDITPKSTVDEYGHSGEDSVCLLGANYYKLEPPSEAEMREAPFITWLTRTGAGSPEGILAAYEASDPAPVHNGRAYLSDSQTEALFLATDVAYKRKDTAPRPYKATVITPYIHIDQLSFYSSPIMEGDTDMLNFVYDLPGTDPDSGVFKVKLNIIQTSGPSMDFSSLIGDSDQWTGPQNDWYPPIGAKFCKPGTYNFTFQLTVPVDDWEVPQVLSQRQCSLLVKKKPASDALRSREGGPFGSALEIAR
jgi:hypothetical protein